MKSIILYTLLFVANSNIYNYHTVDIIELNTVKYKSFSQTMTQYIFWDWSPDYKRYHCQGWALEKNTSISKIGDMYYLNVVRHDKIIRIKSKVFKITKTSYDPERQNVKLFPEEYRKLK